MEDDGLAGWEQQENDERRRRDDEALAHCRVITARSKRETAEFERFMKDSAHQFRQESNRAKGK